MPCELFNALKKVFLFYPALFVFFSAGAGTDHHVARNGNLFVSLLPPSSLGLRDPSPFHRKGTQDQKSVGRGRGVNPQASEEALILVGQPESS